MKKTVAALFCLFCILTLFAACSNTKNSQNEIEAATNVVQNFLNAQSQDDFNGMLVFLSSKYRLKAESAINTLTQTRPQLLNIIILTFKNASYTVIKAEQLKNEIHVYVNTMEPDLDALLDVAADNIAFNDSDSYWQAVDLQALAMAEAGNVTYKAQNYRIVLIKENGYWQIDDEIPIP